MSWHRAQEMSGCCHLTTMSVRQEDCQLQGGQACLPQRPQQQPGPVGQAGQGASREPKHKAFLRDSGYSGGSGQETAEHSAVAHTRREPCRGGFLAVWAARPQEGGPGLGPGASHLLCLLHARHRERATDQITSTLGSGPKKLLAESNY